MEGVGVKSTSSKREAPPIRFDNVTHFLAHAADNFALQLLETDSYFNAVAEALDDTERWHQRECSLKAPLVVWLVLAGALYRAKSWASILTMLLSQYRIHHPELSLNEVTSEAACHARGRLGFEPVAAVFRRLSEDIRGVASFHGLRVWAVDGTFFTIADTQKNEAVFGRIVASRGSTGYPQVHATTLMDTITHEVKGVVLGRSDKTDERSDAVELIDEHLCKGDLLLMDCGVSAQWIFQHCIDREVDFLARISAQWNPKIIATNGPGDYIVTVETKTQRRRRSHNVLRLRMIVYKVGDDQTVRLLTTLTNAKFGAEELAVLYHGRWEIELGYDELKTHLAALQHGKQKTVFRGKSPDLVRQEFYGLIVANNLVRRMMAEAATLESVDPRFLSFVDTLTLIELATPHYQRTSTDSDRDTVRAQLIGDIAKTLNPRPRRPRHYPRAVKVKMSSYALKRGGGCYRDYVAELRLVEPDPQRYWSRTKSVDNEAGG